MLANMTHVFPAKKYIYSYVFSTGLRCAMLASMIHVGEHDSCWRAWLTSSTALLYQILRWNLSRNFSWVRKKSLFKLGFQVPLSNGRIFRCYNATETRVREITRHRVKQIILLSIIHQVYWVILAVAWERRKFPPLSRCDILKYITGFSEVNENVGFLGEVLENTNIKRWCVWKLFVGWSAWN